MTGATTGEIDSAPATAPGDLVTLAERIPEVAGDAALDLRRRLGARYGRLADLAAWLAATQGRTPPRAPRHVGCVLVGVPAPAAVPFGGDAKVTMRELTPPGDVAVAVRAGISAADAAVDSGTELLVVLAGVPSIDVSAGALVSLLRGAEPVAVLPRGAAAVDSRSWVGTAAALRDLRRGALPVRSDPERLLARLGSAVLAATTGLVLAATARRTALVLDGQVCLAAALLVAELAPAAVGWWQAASTSADPVHALACAQLRLRPVLDLDLPGPDAAAALLTLPVIGAAAAAR